ncbi:MAG: hypothetical protein GOMPHAMPRED_007442 [Gomphillus americanus]|uniref:Uncharacterized protein n=1 Tax=Gomphillus americanus TaxID=1940652 RepID=A0A8H3ETT0_9LECA|nr:MAG: hypothetical protein GOMPHAMPRED_007442 [Gomphillus americanus]
MRWDAAANQTFFSLVLNTYSVEIDYNELAAKWPTTEGIEGPTPRALQEQVKKIRKNAAATTGKESKKSTGAGKKAFKTTSEGATVSKKRKPATDIEGSEASKKPKAGDKSQITTTTGYEYEHSHFDQAGTVSSRAYTHYGQATTGEFDLADEED